MTTAGSYGLLDVGISLARQWMLIVLVPILVGLCTASYLMNRPFLFTAVARVLPPQQNKTTASTLIDQIGGSSGLANSALTLKDPTDLYIGIMSSQSILRRVIKKSKLDKHYGNIDIYALMNALETATTIRVAKDGILKISVTDIFPDKAAEIANHYIESFYSFAEETSRRDAARRSQYLKVLLDSAKKRLDDADSALRRIEEATGLVRLSGQEQAIVSSLVEMSALINITQAKLKAMRTYGTNKNPEVRRLRNELSQLIAQRNLLKTSRNPLSSSIKNSSKTPNGRSVLLSIDDIPGTLEQTVKVRREVKFSEILYEMVSRSYELSKIDTSRDLSLLQVLDYATAPTTKSAPRIVITTFGASFATFSILIFLIVFIDSIRLDKRRSNSFGRLCKALLRKPL